MLPQQPKNTLWKKKHKIRSCSWNPSQQNFSTQCCFKKFFDQLEFLENQRYEACMALTTISMGVKPNCTEEVAVTYSGRNRRQPASVITFSDVDMAPDVDHLRPLYLPAKI
ncbi:hypothetical protein BVC80_1331g7 [Macleaya cordata]|uniref:Uncharacterized protein n=1 Tax=Macleaya cordata TaxID=56857 RepID=A0A200QY07_MACCD|nr:hypothetical protein BVC80_1331g7 [Macleaya cordata]